MKNMVEAAAPEASDKVKRKSAGRFQFIHLLASPNAKQSNKQSTPTPYRISISLAGSGYTTSLSVFFDCYTHFVLEIGDFVDEVKQKRFF